MLSPRLTPALLAAAALAACGAPAEAPPAAAVDTVQAAPVGNFRGRIYERSFVFSASLADTALTVPMLFESRTRPGGVDRRARGWLRRGSTWDAFYAERWETPPTRVPWRLLPHGALRLLVGEGDGIETILFQEGPRALELELGEILTDWAGPEGQSYRIQEAAVYLAEQRVPGVLLDASRTWATDAAPPGDWAFLRSGDSLQVVLESPQVAQPGATGSYRGWGRLDFRDLQWEGVTVTWTETNAFPAARQDVPVSWRVNSADISGTLRVETAQLQAGEGTGPVLPVDALFGVTGTLRIEGRPYPVRGLVRHWRP